MNGNDKSKGKMIAEAAQFRQRRPLFSSRIGTRSGIWGGFGPTDKKYRLMVDNASEAITVVQEGRFRFFNPATPNVIGHSEETLATRPFAELVHPGDRNIFARRYAFHVSQESVTTINALRFIDRHGEVRWVEMKAVPIEWEGQPASLVCFNNRTEHIQAEEAMRESENRFRTLFDYADDAIFFVAENHEIVDANHLACKLFGYKRESLLQMKMTALYPSAEAFPSIYSDPGLSSESPLEIIARHREGHEIAVEYTITPLISGRKTIFMSIVRDCTERKRMEEERVNQEKIAAILEMTGAVCHELNQPMMASFGFIELLLMKMAPDDPLYDKIQKLKVQMERMGLITRKLLKITRYKTKRYLEGQRIFDIDNGADK